MKITYQKETFVDIMDELPALFLKHYDEVALDKVHMKLNPAWKQYIVLEQTGTLHILTMRADKRLVGYHFNIVYPHLHYADVLCSWSDMFYVEKGPMRYWYRGIMMFVHNERMLKALGVKKIFVMTKVHIDVRKVMKRLKYKFIERIFSKWIGD